MTPTQLHRFHVLQRVLDGTLSRQEAADLLHLSSRQVKRLLARLREEGAAGLLHHNRGRAPANRLDAALATTITTLARDTYAACNDQHCTELLAEREGIVVSRATVRRLRRADAQAPKRRRRAPTARRRRPRQPAAGAMVLWDGSPHRWFGPDRPPCCLMAAIDDATGAIVGLHFLPQESSAGYLELLRQMATTVGLPHRIYQDCHGALRRNDQHWTIAEELRGRQDPTQVGRVLEELDILPIFAHSPQAKGRAERLFNTLQDRLVVWLAFHHLTTPAEANPHLPTFQAAFNARFAVPAADATPVWRPWPAHLDLARTLAFRYAATISRDHVVRCASQLIPVPAHRGGRSRAGTRVDVRQLLDGRWRVYEGDVLLAETPATTLLEPLRAYYRRKAAPPAADAPDDTWEPGPPDVPFWEQTPEEVELAVLTQRTRPGHGLEGTRIA